MSNASEGLVYVTWDGPGADHLAGLFAPILERVASTLGVEVRILQGQRSVARAVESTTLSHRVYQPMAVNSGRLSRLAVPLMMARMWWALGRALRRQPGIVITRSVVPGLLMLLRFPTQARWIYDSDGFISDLRVAFDAWPEHGLVTRLVRGIEDACLRRADHVLVRTPWAADQVRLRTGARDQATIVANGRDRHVFAPASDETRRQTRRQLGLPTDAVVLLYVGSAAPRQLPREVLSLAGELLPRQDVHVLLVTHDEAAFREYVRQEIAPSRHAKVHIVTASPSHVADIIRVGDLAFTLQADCDATRTIATTKMGEYLLSGVPTVASRHAHPIAATVAAARAGWLVDEVTSMTEVLDSVVSDREGYRVRARELGLEHCSLEKAEHDYVQAIRHVERAAQSS